MDCNNEYQSMKALDKIRELVDKICTGKDLEDLRYAVNSAMDHIATVTVIQYAQNIFNKYGVEIDLISPYVHALCKEIDEDMYFLDGDDEDDDEDNDWEDYRPPVRMDFDPENFDEYGDWPVVVFYVPGYGPSISREQIVRRGFNPNDPDYREMRFLDTNYLICFSKEDCIEKDDKYYLSGPAVIYAVDRKEQIRSLAEDEVMDILSICVHKEEKIGITEMPAIRLC